MNVLEAHERIAAAYHYDQVGVIGWLPDGAELHSPPGTDFTVAVLTAAAMLSGGLDEAETIDDVRECVEQFGRLLASEIVTVDDWRTAAADVVNELLCWGESVMGVWN